MKIKMKNRSTRRAFGRRALAFGAAMFAMVTLTAVGFAAWLISTNATASASGNIVTQTVTRKDIEIKVLNVDGSGHLIDDPSKETPVPYDIIFAPPKDVVGLISWDSQDNKDKPESLKFSFNGTVGNHEMVGELKFSIRVPDEIVKAAGFTPTEAGQYTYAPENAFIALPAFATDMKGNSLPLISNDGTWDGSNKDWKEAAKTAPIVFKNISELTGEGLKSGPITLAQPVEGKAFTFTATDVAFGWGARYGSQNPVLTFNEKGDWGEVSTNTGVEQGKPYTTNQLQLELIKLQVVVNNLDMDQLIKNAKINFGDGVTTIDNYVKGNNNAEIQESLAALQEAVNAAMEVPGFARPVYTLYIEANVR